MSDVDRILDRMSDTALQRLAYLRSLNSLTPRQEEEVVREIGHETPPAVGRIEVEDVNCGFDRWCEAEHAEELLRADEAERAGHEADYWAGREGR